MTNNTQNTYQLLLHTDEEYLCGELRSTTQDAHTFHIHAKDEYFSREEEVIFRNGQVIRDVIDSATGDIVDIVDSKVIRVNHARVMYDLPEGTTVKEEQ